MFISKENKPPNKFFISCFIQLYFCNLYCSNGISLLRIFLYRYNKT